MGQPYRRLAVVIYGIARWVREAGLRRLGGGTFGTVYEVFDRERSARTLPAFDEAKLRSVFRQLAEGLCFLHESGRHGVHSRAPPSICWAGS
jgi:hypothetical protein